MEKDSNNQLDKLYETTRPDLGIQEPTKKSNWPIIAMLTALFLIIIVGVLILGFLVFL